MSSYAPLLGHVDAWQWTPNLIWFDNLRSYGTPSYYVQKLFGTHRGTTILPVEAGGSTRNGQGDLFTSAARDDRTGEVTLKLVNCAPAARDVQIELAGASRVGRRGQAVVLAGSDLKAENSFAEPVKVAPVSKPFAVPSGSFPYSLSPYSVTVLRMAASTR